MMYTTITFIRVQEIGDGECWGCVANTQDIPDDTGYESDSLCNHLMTLNGQCRGTNMIYIIDHPEHIANYTKQRITK